MAAISVAGDTSGTCTLQAPAVAGSTVLTLPAQTGTVMVNGPAFSAYQSSAQTALSANVYTKLLFQTEEFDTNNNFASSTFTPTVAGYYQINAAFAANTTTTLLQISLFKNGTVIKSGSFLAGLNYGNPCMIISVLVFCNGSTDYLEIYGSTGVSLQPLAGASNTYFQAILARSA